MAVTLEDVKMYLRVDLDIEDRFIQQCMRGAESYLMNAVDDFKEQCKYEDFASSADILRLALIAEMYTHRDGADEKAREFPYHIRSMIAQLQNYVPAGAP